MPFSYPCPDCRTRTSLHDPDCRYEGTPWDEIERAYTDVVATLSGGARRRAALQSEVEPWDRLHRDALGRLLRENRVAETAGGALELLSPEEFKEEISVPSEESLNLIYEEGSVPGCHDHALFALVAYYEMVGLTWGETRERVIDWLHESETWVRGGFEEGSPEELVDSKRHVYEQGYGWRQAAEEAAAVIRRQM